MVLDESSLSILRALREDGRASVREIAKKTGLRPSTVHQKIVRLKESKTIEKFTVKVNNDAVGEGFIVYMLIKTKPNVTLDHISSLRNVKEVFGITGEYDLLAKMKFKDVNEFNDFIIKFRKSEKIISTLTMVATANIKEEI